MKHTMTFLILAVLGIIPLSAERNRPGWDYNFQSKNRIYVHMGANALHFTDFGLGGGTNGTNTRLAPIVGAGFSLINFGYGRGFLNLEADYTRSSFDFDMGHERNASALTFMAQGEMRFGRSPFSVYLGVGVGVLSLDRIRYSHRGYDYELYPETDASLAMDLGWKYSLLPHLMLRMSARFHLFVYDSGYEYWDDDLEDWLDDMNSELMATSVALGLEYHF